MPDANPLTLGEVFRRTALQYPDKEALLAKRANRYEATTWSQLEKKVDALAVNLIGLGVRLGDRVAILSENRPEWAETDLACQLIGAATVPIYTSLTSSEIQYILNDSSALVLAVSNKSLLEKIVPIQKSLPALKAVIAFEATLTVSRDEIGVPLLLMKDLEKPAADTGPMLEARTRSVKTDAIATVIYTSGTTGVPKGVLLTHGNFIENVLACQKAFRMDNTERHLSFLPLSHVFERTAGYYLPLSLGASIAYAESMDTVPKNLTEASPTYLLGVPRFYEKIRDRVLEAVNAGSSIKKGLFAWACDIGQKKRIALETGKKNGLFFALEYAIAERLAFHKFKKRLGGHVRFCISGGAPLAKEIAEFFFDLGVLIVEGYGLTETSPVISVNREEKFRFGTVGIPLEGVQVKISDEGEILTRSACVMKGYLGKPAETSEVMRDGWFCTGDLGCIDKDGFLKITGRKKELIVTSGGKKVAPRPIEEALESDPAIVRCVLYGEGHKFLTALIVPDRASLENFARSEKIAFTNYPELLKNPAITKFIGGRIEERTKDLASFEKIKYFHLLENDFTQNAGELTPTLKVKRELVLSRHREILEAFYQKA